MPTVYQRAQEQRAALLRRDKEVAARLIDAYKQAEDDLLARLKAVTDLMELRRARGEEITLAWLYRQERYQEFLNQTREKMADLAAMCGDETVQAQKVAVNAAFSDATELISLGAAEAGLHVTFTHQPQGAIDNLVSSLAPDAPLAALLNEFGKEAAEKAKNALITGVAAGSGIPVITANFRAATGATLSRSLLIARTETLRSYRTASLQAYQESDLIESWIWTSTLEEHTCAACLALHNTIHPKDEPFASHPACRCCPRPLVAGGKVRGQAGEEWFEQQDEATKKRILGPRAFEEYQKGTVSLKDFVHYDENLAYGTSVRRASIDAAKAAHKGEAAFTRRLPVPARNDDAMRVRQKIEDTHRIYDERLKPLQDQKAGLERGLLDVYGHADRSETFKALDRIRAVSARIQTIQDERDERVVKLLEPPAKADIKFDLAANLDLRARAVAEKEGAFFQRLVGSEGAEGTIVMKPTAKIRSFFDRDTKEVGIDSQVGDPSDLSRGFVVHELGHWLEDRVPAIHEAALAFYDRRTAGEPLVALSEASGDQRYGEREVTRVDKFPNPYMGKEYPGREETEIISMGLQEMYLRPREFAKGDADYFDFLWRVLRTKH